MRGHDGLVAAVAGAAVHQGRVVLPPHPAAGEFVARMSDFLETYGWRSDVCLELGHPSWQEDPATALTQLKGFLADDAAQSPYARQAAERDARMRLEQDFAARLPEPARPVFHALLPLVQQYVPVAEDHNFTIDQKYTVVTREAFLNLGRRLVQEGHVADADDIFYLTHDEIGAIADGHAPASFVATVARRKAACSRRPSSARRRQPTRHPTRWRPSSSA